VPQLLKGFEGAIANDKLQDTRRFPVDDGSQPSFFGADKGLQLIDLSRFRDFVVLLLYRRFELLNPVNNAGVG